MVSDGGGGFKHRENLKMHGQLPDYDEFQCYDLGIDSELIQIDGKNYANFQNPSRRSSRRHLFLAVIPEKLFHQLKILAAIDKKTNLNKRECPGV